MARRENPEINAGSMADIAFLLLIFFLVTTTMNVDSGISKKLSEKPPPDYKPPVIKEKNIFEVNINRNNDLLVEGEIMVIDELKEAINNKKIKSTETPMGIPNMASWSSHWNPTNLFNESPPWEIISGAYLPKYEKSKKQIAIITRGNPNTLLVASINIKIPQLPIINSTGKLNFSQIVTVKRIPPLSTNWS